MKQKQLNKVEIIGYVSAVTTEKVGDTLNLNKITVTTNYASTGKDGWATIETTWHKVNAYLDVDVAVGDKVYVEGRLQSAKMKLDNGSEVMTAEIYANSLEVLEKKDDEKTDTPKKKGLFGKRK